MLGMDTSLINISVIHRPSPFIHHSSLQTIILLLSVTEVCFKAHGGSLLTAPALAFSGLKDLARSLFEMPIQIRIQVSFRWLRTSSWDDRPRSRRGSLADNFGDGDDKRERAGSASDKRRCYDQ